MQGKKTGSYCFHELYAYQWKLRNKEVWHVAAVTLWQSSCTSASGLFALKRFKYDSSNWKAILPYAEIHHGSLGCWPGGQMKIFCNCCFEEQVKCWQAFSSDMFLLWINFNLMWFNSISTNCCNPLGIFRTPDVTPSEPGVPKIEEGRLLASWGLARCHACVWLLSPSLLGLG